ncbi:MAG: hypothetical protein JXA54_09175 [Candidatus Heimdallarchaeota archaeon]|nr:hypothetical protein [Candidatus Heimdallarchaeota archaeon]
MDWKILRKIIFFFTASCLFLFIILLSLAIFYYPGGSRFDYTVVGFDFLNTFVSDLGRNIALNGEENSISQIFFMIGITIMGLSQIYYFCNLPFEIRNKKSSFILTIIGSTIGLVSCILYIAIAYNPWDVNSDLHNKLIYSAAPLLCIAAIIITLAIFLDKQFSKFQGYIFLLLVILFVIFAFATAIGTTLPNQIKWNFRILGHTILIYAEAILFGIVSICMYKHIQTINKHSSRVLQEKDVSIIQAKI